jgi:hypothetical protein
LLVANRDLKTGPAARHLGHVGNPRRLRGLARIAASPAEPKHRLMLGFIPLRPHYPGTAFVVTSSGGQAPPGHRALPGYLRAALRRQGERARRPSLAPSAAAGAQDGDAQGAAQ